jgi:hypothetical protein
MFFDQFSGQESDRAKAKVELVGDTLHLILVPDDDPTGLPLVHPPHCPVKMLMADVETLEPNQVQHCVSLFIYRTDFQRGRFE